MTARKATRARKPRPRASDALPVPAEGWDAPLHELDRDSLSVFLYLALMPEETSRLVRDLNLSQPGFRQESLGEVQRCDLLADEIRARPEQRAPVIEVLRAGWERPVLAGWPIAPEPAVDLLDACAGEGALSLALWRVLCDPASETRAEARPFLARLAEAYYGPPGQDAPRTAAEDPAQRLQRERDDLARKLQEAEQRADRAEARAESARKKGEDAREKLQSWLKEARAHQAHATAEAARAREAADEAQRERARVEAELAAARAQDVAVEAQRLRSALRDAESRGAAIEGRLARAREREEELLGEVERARAAAAPTVSAVPGAPPTDHPTELEEAPATWLTPVYTREFYGSIEGWDRRVQRAAFKQAALLAQDHRHPSLRALPLEGLPGYYRVRVATDVRLIYRRTERQNTIEILSLIDREDLDRYIKQAKTRAP